MSNVINLKRGLNIRLKGDAVKVLETSFEAVKLALKPTDFPGLLPKRAVVHLTLGLALFSTILRP